MGCRKCGCSTPHRICRECERMERAEEQARRSGPGLALDVADCPECGGQTSGEGVVCWRCR